LASIILTIVGNGVDLVILLVLVGGDELLILGG